LHPAARTFYAREQSSAGTLIGKLSAVDTDKDDKISFEIIGKTLFGGFEIECSYEY
jgi:hypothetical protein